MMIKTIIMVFLCAAGMLIILGGLFYIAMELLNEDSNWEKINKGDMDE